MTVLTILNHGTANSTDTRTSEGNVLVISKIAALLDGPDWILNEGAGTAELRKQGIDSPEGKGIAGGKGVEDNVARAVEWVKKRHREQRGQISVNLAGHSRGSITCYKIARALCDHRDTANVPINIFAIDPVPGNTGNAFTNNGENYKNIVLGGNVWPGRSVLMLAESEHRLVFRPYVDALYSVGLPRHRLDTIPGTHGGINMLGGYEDEAAQIVLSQALEFLKANNSTMSDAADQFILSEKERMKLYSELMWRLKKYKAHASLNPFKKGGNLKETAINIVTAGLRVDTHRIANVQGKKADFGPGMAGTADDKAHLQGRKDHHGLKMSEALQRVMPGDGKDEAHSKRPHRFFCNLDHQNLFGRHYPELIGNVKELERSGAGDMAKIRIKMKVLGEGAANYQAMDGMEKRYFDRFLAKRGIVMDR
jgi:hypothetical protein